jgi:cytochrome c553
MIRLAILTAAAVGVTPATEGRALFQSGDGAPHVTMWMAGSIEPSPGTPLACAGCHGSDGTGSIERVQVPSLARLAATAEDRVAFRNAVERGIGRDGKPLALMPRYVMTTDQRNALAAYIAMLDRGSPLESGLTDRSIAIDVSQLSPTARQSAANTIGQSRIYDRDVALVIDTPAFATITTDLPLPMMMEALRRTGRRLTQAGFRATLETMKREEAIQ